MFTLHENGNCTGVRQEDVSSTDFMVGKKKKLKAYLSSFFVQHEPAMLPMDFLI